MNAALDVKLTKQLNAGKLFVGQKLRVSCKVYICSLANGNIHFFVRSLTYSMRTFVFPI